MFMSMEIMFDILIEENVGKLKTKILWQIQYFVCQQGTLYMYEATCIKIFFHTKISNLKG